MTKTTMDNALSTIKNVAASGKPVRVAVFELILCGLMAMEDIEDLRGAGLIFEQVVNKQDENVPPLVVVDPGEFMKAAQRVATDRATEFLEEEGFVEPRKLN